MNILLSSYDFHEPWAQDIMKPILKPSMKVVVIPFSFDKKEVQSKEQFDQHYGPQGKHIPYIYRPFDYYGLKDITILDYYRDSYEYMQQCVKKADILFMTGGLPDQYLGRLNECGLSDLIRKGNYIVIGASAGAMVQLTHYHVTPDDDYPEYIYLKGLGLVDGFEVEVHYCHSDIQNWGIQRVIEEKGLPTYTIANDGGLLVSEGKIISFGNAFLVNSHK